MAAHDLLLRLEEYAVHRIIPSVDAICLQSELPVRMLFGRSKPEVSHIGG